MKPENKIRTVMREFKKGELHSGPGGKVVKNPKQAIAIALSEAGKSKPMREGGEMKESKSMMKKEVAFMKKKGAPKSMIKHEMKEAGMKRGGYAGGGMTKMTPTQSKPPMPPKISEPIGIQMNNPSAMKQMRARAAGRMAEMKSGGLAAGHKSADGIARKGKTRGMEVKMAGNKRMMGGGKC